MADTDFPSKLKQRELMLTVLGSAGSPISTNQIIDRVDILADNIVRKENPSFPKLSWDTANKILMNELQPKHIVKKIEIEYGARMLELWAADKTKLKFVDIMELIKSDRKEK